MFNTKIYEEALARVDSDNEKVVLEDGNSFTMLVQRVRDNQIENIRRDGTIDELKLCAELCFSQMVPVDKWRRNHKSVEISSLLTIADEAFALVTFENNLEEWMVQAVKGESKKKRRRLTKYTTGQTYKDGTKKGWSLAGKKRFNEIYDAIACLRNTEHSKNRERTIMNMWMDKSGDTTSDDSATSQTDDTEEAARAREEESFVPRNGFGFAV